MRDALLAHFERHARELPWRRPPAGGAGPGARRDPYAVLVAEIMLQQTRVDTVIPYFARWMRRFPDLAALAAASEGEVLRVWEGLGYYRRAGRLRRAAEVCVLEHGGRVPGGVAQLRRLPGVGAYTAAAVAAFAFDMPELPVDGNVRRVAARLRGDRGSPSDRDAAEALGPLLAGGRAGDAAEALMELGALVCTPRAPACPSCPLRSGCAAAAAGTPESFGAPVARRAPPKRRRWACVATDGGRVWLERRPERALLGGLWGFPQLDAEPDGARLLPPVRHAYSHFRLELVPAVVPLGPYAAGPDDRPRADPQHDDAQHADREHDEAQQGDRQDADPQQGDPQHADGARERERRASARTAAAGAFAVEALARLPLSVVDRRVLRALVDAGLLPAVAAAGPETASAG